MRALVATPAQIRTVTGELAAYRAAHPGTAAAIPSSTAPMTTAQVPSRSSRLLSIWRVFEGTRAPAARCSSCGIPPRRKDCSAPSIL